MRIGLIITVDRYTLLPYINCEKDRDTVTRNCRPIGAPSVNALIHSFLKAGHFIRIFMLAKQAFIVKTPQLEIFAAQSYDRYPAKYIIGSFKDTKSLRQLMHDNISDLDVLHAHWTYENAYSALPYAQQMPVFCSVRDIASYIWRIETPKNKITWTFKVLMNHIVLTNKHIHFIANSPYTAAVIKKKFGKDLPVIPNSIKDSFIKHGSHIPPKNFRILCISSSNDRRKNIISLLCAYRMFKSAHHGTTLQLVGAPFTDSSKAVRQWAKAGLLDGVELVGLVTHDGLTTYIDQCSVFVTPSLEETFGNTLLEAIVRKVPVIGGEKSGAVPYVLLHGRAGYLCDVSSPKSISETLDYVFQHQNETKLKTEKAYNIILNRYNEKTVCDKHIRLYEKYMTHTNHTHE